MRVITLINTKQQKIFKNKNERSKGFTLIELMLAIAILGLLMSLAIPAYSNYSTRTKVSEAINVLASVKLAVSEYRMTQGDWPEDNESVGLSDDIASRYVESIIVEDELITATLDSDAVNIEGDVMLEGEYTEASGNINWRCGGTVALKYLPSSCRENLN